MLTDFKHCAEAFSFYGIELSRKQYEKLDIYAEFLVEHNKKVNLTSITQPEDILFKHFIDSTVIGRFVPENSSVIDIGTGAGFPSVPLKIMREDVKITLLDSLNKRIDFLEQLCRKLEIEAEFVHGRAEDIAKFPEYRECFDIACARAVANMSTLSEMCLPFVKVGGTFLAMKGDEDISSAEGVIELLGGEVGDIYEYSMKGDERKIVQVKKISQTSPKYPRNSNQIKKKPL